jgi:hypothetical protein
MSDIQINIQDHLRDMERRISRQIESVHEDVKKQTDRVHLLEQGAERRETKLKWLIGTVSSSITSALAWAGWHLANHQ